MGASPPTLDSQTDSSVSTPPMDTGGVASDDTNIHPVVRTSSYTPVFSLYIYLAVMGYYKTFSGVIMVGLGLHYVL